MEFNDVEWLCGEWCAVWRQHPAAVRSIRNRFGMRRYLQWRCLYLYRQRVMNCVPEISTNVCTLCYDLFLNSINPNNSFVKSGLQKINISSAYPKRAGGGGHWTAGADFNKLLSSNNLLNYKFRMFHRMTISLIMNSTM